MTQSINVSAKVDTGPADQALADFEKRFNQLGETVAKLNKLKFQPIDKATLDQLKQVQAGFTGLLNVSKGLSQRMKVTGQAGADPLALNWEALYPHAPSRAIAMRGAFNAFGGGRLLSPLAPAPSAPPAPPAPPPGPARPPSSPPDAPRPSIIGRTVRGGLNGAGALGGVANGAIDEGMAGGVGAGLAGLLGGLAALGVGKLVSSVREKIGSAQQELIGYDTLKRKLGDTGVDYSGLKARMRASANGLGLDLNETMQLGSRFAGEAGLGAGDAGSLHDRVRQGVGFARSFGLDPAQGTGFFAQMKLTGGASSVDDARRLGLMIGEGVARSGAFSKMDEVLEAMAGYASSTSRSGLTAPDMGGYAGLLTTMMTRGGPGLDAASSAAIMGRANSAMMGGGSEGFQNFMYRALGSKDKLDPFQVQVLREQGLFGTGAKTFGKGSIYAQYFGHEGKGASSSVSNIDAVMEQLQKMHGTNDRGLMLTANTLSTNFGMTNSQAMAFAMATKNHGGRALGGLDKRLSRLGFNLGDMAPDAVLRMSAVEANKGLSEKDRDSQILQAAKEGQVKTDGSETREKIAGVSRAVQRAAETLVEPLNQIRAAVMFLAGEGKKSPREIMEAVAKSESDDRVNQINGKYAPAMAAARSRYTSAQAKLTELKRLANPNRIRASGEAPVSTADMAARMAAVQKEAADAQREMSDLEQQRGGELGNEQTALAENIGKIRSGGPTAAGSLAGNGKYDALFDSIGLKEGVEPRLLKAIALQENAKMDPSARGALNKNGTVDMGLMQHNSRYLHERGLDNTWSDPSASIRAAAKLLKANGVDDDMWGAVRRYNGTGEAADHYRDSVQDIYSQTRLPAGAAQRDGAPVKVDVTVNGHVAVQDTNGRTMPGKTTLAASVRTPQPAGVH